MIFSFLSNDWSGLVLALLVVAAGLLFLKLGRQVRAKGLRWSVLAVSAVLAAVGLVLAVTSTMHGVAVARMWQAHPPMGDLVDVGGYRLHMMAEGENAGRPSVIFIPGGHSSGLNFYNFHKVFRDDTRSILFDRAASGWSDVGPYPRSCFIEAEELNRLLQVTGQTDPVVLVGHSYGGLLAVIYAMRYPEQVAGLVLLDAGFAELYQNPTAAGFLNQYADGMMMQGVIQMFGLNALLPEPDMAPGLAEVIAHYERELADVWEDIKQSNLASRNSYGSASVFREINHPEFFETGLIRPGILNGIPVSSVTYLGGADLESEAAMEFVLGIRPDLDREGAMGQIDGLRATREKILTLSDRVQTYSIPQGASHNFPFELPAFVEALVRDMYRRIDEPNTEPLLGADLPHGLALDTGLPH